MLQRLCLKCDPHLYIVQHIGTQLQGRMLRIIMVLVSLCATVGSCRSHVQMCSPSSVVAVIRRDDGASDGDSIGRLAVVAVVVQRQQKKTNSHMLLPQ